MTECQIDSQVQKCLSFYRNGQNFFFSLTFLISSKKRIKLTIFLKKRKKEKKIEGPCHIYLRHSNGVDSYNGYHLTDPQTSPLIYVAFTFILSFLNIFLSVTRES